MDGSLEGQRNIYISIIELAGQTAYGKRGPCSSLSRPLLIASLLDLLNSRKQISILEDSLGITQMAGAQELQVNDKNTLLGLIEAAAALRRTAPTLKNDTSSRSHAICRLRFENPEVPAADDGLLYLIDLAGSEAARDKTAHDASRMKEAREINTSLSVLKDCIRGRALADADTYAGKPTKKPAYVPFRQSTLTKTLKHVFDPTSARSCKTVVVACVNPCLADIGASKNTLRYAEMLRAVIPKAKAAEYNPLVPATWNNGQLNAWIKANVRPPLLHPHCFPESTPLTNLPVRHPPHLAPVPQPDRNRPPAPPPAHPRLPGPLPAYPRRRPRAGASLPDQAVETAHRLHVAAFCRVEICRGRRRGAVLHQGGAARLERRSGARF